MTDEPKLRFLIVDDEQSIRRLCVTVGQGLGYECCEADTAEAALETLEMRPPDIVVTDLKLPNLSGGDLLRKIKEALPTTEVAIMTGHGSVESAVGAMKLGAYDYIEKPFRVERLRQLLQRMAEKVRLVTENQFLRERVSSETQLDGIVGSSAKIQDMLKMISRLKETRTPVLITGESGTGKELIARAMHYRGPLARMPFIAVDCGSLVPTLMESELFGHEKGSFTGALKTKSGLFQAANGGTIFLDEIGELPIDLQSKLLRALQEKEVRPVGGTKAVPIDVRVLAATNRDLEQAVAQGTFRKDLYFRLNVLSLRIPQLRQRKQDIPLLVGHFLERLARSSGVQRNISDDALKLMLSYDWPGNIRELENCIERACALTSGPTIHVADLPTTIQNWREQIEPADERMIPRRGILPIAEMEKQAILGAVEMLHGDKLEAARLLGIGKTTLYRKLKEYGALL
jgi:DNA-binding NtrC family response regulator